MPIPLLVPAIATALGGAFIGSQIDDAVENNDIQNTSAEAKITSFDVIKIFIFAGGALYLYGKAKSTGLIK